MKKGFIISAVAAISIILIGAGFMVDKQVYKIPDNPYFQQLNTTQLFTETGEIADSVVFEYVAAQSNAKWKAYRVKVNSVGADTLFSKIFPIVSGNTQIYCIVDSLAGDSLAASLYLGLYRGLAYGDSLGFQWHLLKTFSGTAASDTLIATLKDSTWFADQASPYGMLKIVENDSTVLGWFFDIFGYEGRGR